MVLLGGGRVLDLPLGLRGSRTIKIDACPRAPLPYDKYPPLRHLPRPPISAPTLSISIPTTQAVTSSPTDTPSPRQISSACPPRACSSARHSTPARPARPAAPACSPPCAPPPPACLALPLA